MFASLTQVTLRFHESWQILLTSRHNQLTSKRWFKQDGVEDYSCYYLSAFVICVKKVKKKMALQMRL